jgi:hypothetical protein
MLIFVYYKYILMDNTTNYDWSGEWTIYSLFQNGYKGLLEFKTFYLMNI